MRVLALLLALAATSVAASASTADDPWTSLHRPLKVPRLASGAPCPISRVDRAVPWLRFGIGPGIGRGPAYPVGFGADGTLAFAPPENFESTRWGGQKVLWFVHQRYRGPVLIRGRRLDGWQLVRFERGDIPPDELRIESEASSAWWKGKPPNARGNPSYTRLRAPGCYAYQVDGTTFSRIVVFRAIRSG